MSYLKQDGEEQEKTSVHSVFRLFFSLPCSPQLWENLSGLVYVKKRTSLSRFTCMKCNSRPEADASLEPSDELHVKKDIFFYLLFEHNSIYFVPLLKGMLV